MNCIENKKYLKSNDLHFYIGWFLLAFGIVLFALQEFWWIFIVPYQWIVSILLMIVGAVVAFVPRINRASEESLDEQVCKIGDEMAKKNEEILGKRQKNPGEGATVVGNYLLSGEGLLVRRGRKDGRYRSSRYACAAFSFAKEGLYILTRTFSLISNEDAPQVIEIPYTAAPVAQIEERNLALSGGRYRQKELVVLENGCERLRIPVENSVFVEDLCQRISSEAKRALQGR